MKTFKEFMRRTRAVIDMRFCDTMWTSNDPAFAHKPTFRTLACKRESNVIAKEIAIGI